MLKIKNILIFIGVALVLVLAYFFIFKKTPVQPSLISSTGNSVLPTNTKQGATPEISQDFLTVLLSVKNIKIDDSIFTDPAFLSLNDSTIQLVSDGNEGRQNPFAPLGSDISVINTPTISTTTPIIEIPTITPSLPTIPPTPTPSGNTGSN